MFWWASTEYLQMVTWLRSFIGGEHGFRKLFFASFSALGYLVPRIPANREELATPYDRSSYCIVKYQEPWVLPRRLVSEKVKSTTGTMSSCRRLKRFSLANEHPLKRREKTAGRERLNNTIKALHFNVQTVQKQQVAAFQNYLGLLRYRSPKDVFAKPRQGHTSDHLEQKLKVINNN